MVAIYANSSVLNEDSTENSTLVQTYKLKRSLNDLEKTKGQNKTGYDEIFSSLSVEGTMDNKKGISYSYEDFIKLSDESQSIFHSFYEATLTSSVKKALYDLMVHKQILELTVMNLELAKNKWQQMQTSFDNGLSSELDVIEAQSTYENLKSDYSNANTAYKQKLKEFKTLLSSELNKKIKFEGNIDFELENLDDDSLISSFLSNNFDAESAEKFMEEEKDLLNTDKSSNISPSLSLSLDYNAYDSDSYIFTSDFKDCASITFTLSIPLNSSTKNSEADVAESEVNGYVE